LIAEIINCGSELRVFFTRLSCRKVEQMWFDLMMSYGDLGNFLRNSAPDNIN
jgi:hypothetical protein